MKMDCGEKIYVVLVNYNGMKYIKECIDSVYRQTYKDIKIVVVDNASSDGSLQILETYKDLVLIKRNKNEGFAKGCNIGIKYALKAKAEYVMLLNIDTVIDDDMICKLYQNADSNTVTTPKIFADYAKTKIWYSGGKIDYQYGKHIQYQDRRLEGTSVNTSGKSVQFACGCCMLVHRDIWRKIGLLDEKYFMYFDDDDLSLRFLKGKIKILYIPSATMWHKVGGCFQGSKNNLTQYYCTRNRLYFTKKHSDIMQVSFRELSWTIFLEQVIFPDQSDRPFRRYVIKGIIDFYMQRMYQANYDFSTKKRKVANIYRQKME